jgi:hypothetical protein
MNLSPHQIRVIGAFAGINLLLVLIGWMAFVSPQQNDAATANAAAQVAQTQLDLLNGQNPSGHVKQPTIHTSNLYALDTALPAQLDEPDLLFELDRIGEATGVKVLSIAPQPATANPGNYTVLPINVTVSGSYYGVTNFLHTLRTLVYEQHGRLIAHGPLFAPSSVTFTSSGTAGNSPATIGLQAFFYGTTAGATAPVSTLTTDTTTTTGS